MKKFFQRFTTAQIIWAVVGLSSLLLGGGLALFAAVKKGGIADQQTARRWAPEGGAAQITCFVTEGAIADHNAVRMIENNIDFALQEAAITAQKENARLWADAYSAQGKVKLEFGKKKLEVDAVGAGGDFFQFHPLRLLSGSYFSGNDLMHDAVVIDQDTAWQLFGSSDVAGMELTIDGVVHHVAGVAQRPEGRLNEAAGLDKAFVYVSYETLKEHGTTEGIDTYEIVMPEPVKGFAFNTVQKALDLKEDQYRMVDNSKRYSFTALLGVIGAFGTRSMNDRAIRYPYWENTARGWEDIFALVLLFELIFFLIPITLAVIALVLWWRHRNWTFKELWHALLDKWEKFREGLKSQERKWKHF